MKVTIYFDQSGITCFSQYQMISKPMPATESRQFSFLSLEFFWFVLDGL